MHKDDQMTPKERFAAYSKGEAIDRVPIMPFLSVVGSKVAGISMREMRAAGKNEALVQKVCYERFGNDSLMVDYGLHGVGIALGSKVNDPENAVPAVMEWVLKDLNDLDQLDADKLTLQKDPEFQKRYETAQILLDQLGHECGVDVTLSGPFTAAASIYSTNLILRAIRKDPDNVHRLLRFCTDALISICRQFRQLDVSFSICDPIASGTILSPDQYRQFVFPYTVELVKAMHDAGADVGYHICGDTTKIINDMVKTGIDLLSIDNIVDLEAAKNMVGEQICLVGNVDPVNVMLLGGLDDIEACIKNCFRQAHDSPNGYVLSTGCDIPFSTPLENVDQFMAMGRQYGRWPLESGRYQ